MIINYRPKYWIVNNKANPGLPPSYFDSYRHSMLPCFTRIFFFFFFIFSHFYVGSMCLVRRLHLDRSCASSSDNPLSDKSFLMLSIHLRFGLPLLLFPGTSIPNTLFPAYSSSLLETCPYHFNLLSCTFLDISPTFVVPLILSFLILSILVTLFHANIVLYLTSHKKTFRHTISTVIGHRNLWCMSCTVTWHVLACVM